MKSSGVNGTSSDTFRERWGMKIKVAERAALQRRTLIGASFTVAVRNVGMCDFVLVRTRRGERQKKRQFATFTRRDSEICPSRSFLFVFPPQSASLMSPQWLSFFLMMIWAKNLTARAIITSKTMKQWEVLETFPLGLVVWFIPLFNIRVYFWS